MSTVWVKITFIQRKILIFLNNVNYTVRVYIQLVRTVGGIAAPAAL